jgi:hypothetical protein
MAVTLAVRLGTGCSGLNLANIEQEGKDNQELSCLECAVADISVR